MNNVGSDQNVGDALKFIEYSSCRRSNRLKPNPDQTGGRTVIKTDPRQWVLYMRVHEMQHFRVDGTPKVTEWRGHKGEMLKSLQMKCWTRDIIGSQVAAIARVHVPQEIHVSYNWSMSMIRASSSMYRWTPLVIVKYLSVWSAPSSYVSEKTQHHPFIVSPTMWQIPDDRLSTAVWAKCRA